MKNFLRIAKGSAAELETQLLLCKEIGYVDDVKLKMSLDLLDEISRMIRSLMQKS
jgi:four helix bundle protein